jgi:predicted RNA-binding Zn-ribbon protein involved in translation (DUF1610 family)
MVYIGDSMVNNIINLNELNEFRCPECGSTEYEQRIKTKLDDETIYEWYCSDCTYVHIY